MCKVGEGREEREREREKESMLVEVVDDIESGMSDGDPIVFNKLAFCMDAVKGEVIFCARLEVLVKIDLGWLV